MKIVSAIFKTFILSLAIIAQMSFAYAQSQGAIIPNGKTTFFDSNGNPLSSGKVFYYVPSTTTPKTTYQDINQTIPNSNPVVLDAAGRSPVQIWGVGNYRQLVQDQNSNVIWDVTTSTNGTTGTVTTATGDGDLVGTVKPWAGMTAPSQYMFTYGQQISRTTFATLFSAITSTQAVFCTNTLPTLTGLTDTTNFWIGMTVEVACVSGGVTTIIAKTASTVTLAVNANATQNINAIFFPWGNGNGTTTFSLPDLRGLIPIGNNNMGGIASSNITTSGFGATNPNSIGAKGGNTETFTIQLGHLPPSITSQNFAQPITVTTSGSNIAATASAIGNLAVANVGGQNVPFATGGSWSAATSFSGSNSIAVTSTNTGSGGVATPFSLINPARTVNYIIKVTPDANSATASGVTDIQGMTGSISCGTGLTCVGNVIANTVPFVNYITSVTAAPYNAKGDCSTSDTTAFQNAINDANGSTGFGTIFVPQTTSCYLVGPLNGTNKNNWRMVGVGDQSLIKMNGNDAQGNWLDLSGSNNIAFSSLKFIDNGTPVRIGFLWACTGTSCGTSGIVAGLNFDRVNVNGKFVLAGLYGYGYGPLTSVFTGGGALSIANSTWQNTNNSATLVAEETRTAVLDLTAYNAGSVRSAYVTLTTSTAIASQTYISNSIINDAATTGSTKSNNAAIVADGVNQFTMSGGQVGCLCVSDVIGWTSVEGMTFIQTAFQEPLGSVACITTNWAEFGGGINAAISFYNVLFSCPGPGGAIIALDQGVAAANGGIWFLTFEGADVGLNTNNDPFIGETAAGCGSFTATNNWIIQAKLNLVSGANNIVGCGSIDPGSMFQNVGTVTLAAGGVDRSYHIGEFRQEFVNWAPGGTTINAKSHGVASITRGGAGAYTINFLPAWTNINYTCGYTVIDTGASTWSAAGSAAQTTTQAALSIRVASTGVATDPTTAIMAQCVGTR